MERLLLTLLTLVTSTTAMDNPYKLFSGYHFQIQDDIMPYESTIPFMIHTELLWKPNLTTYRDNLQHMSDVYNNTHTINDLTDNLQLLQQLIHTEIMRNVIDTDSYEKPTITRRNRGIISSFLNWCCDVANTKQIGDLFENEITLKEHTNNIIASVDNQYKDMISTTESLNNFTRQTNAMNDMIHETFKAVKRNLQDITMVSTATALEQTFSLTYQTWNYILYSYHRDNLNKIIETCHDGRLSDQIIDKAHLIKELQNLETKSRKLRLRLAIPIELIHLYYSTKLTSCKIINGTLITRVNLPLISINLKGAIYKPIVTPVIWQNHICMIKNTYKYVFTNTKITKTIEENEHTCNDETYPLCKLQRYTSGDNNVLNCIHNIINRGSISELQETCHYACKNRSNIPNIIQLLPNKFLITDTDKNLKIKCNDGNETEIPETDIGTQMIDIPCQCQLEHRNLILISKLQPCDANDIDMPIIQNLIPITWSKIKTLKLFTIQSGIHHEIDNLTELIDKNWQTNYPTFHVTTQQRISNVTLNKNALDIYINKDILIYGLIAWLAILTIVNLLLIYCVHITRLQLKLTLPRRDYNSDGQH